MTRRLHHRSTGTCHGFAVSRSCRLAFLIIGVFVVMMGSSFSRQNPDPPQIFNKQPSRLEVIYEDSRFFSISRPGSPIIHVAFLTTDTFRVHVLPREQRDATLPDYMVIRPDSSYPNVQVHVDHRQDAVTFETATVAVNLSADGDHIFVEVRTPNESLVSHWHIDAARRTARLDLHADEHIYGFGDKRAALDQRGHMVEMLNRDAFASETNDSYKSIPFYMSTAGYGVFFHNFYRSVFDVGASARDVLQLSASGGDMDFYVFIGGLKKSLARYTELTGRPALLPRWAFGYHQGKASYEGREAFEVADEMRRRKLPIDVIYYDNWVEEATEREFIDSLWNQHHVRLTLGFGMPMFGSFRGEDDSTFLNDLASRGFVMVDQKNRPIIGADAHVDSREHPSSVAYLDYFSPRAVDHVFAAKWERALRNGAILGMVDFGELDHIGNTEHKYWPSLNMSVAITRNLYGLVYPLSVVRGVVRRTGGRSTGMVRPGFAGTQRLGWSTTGDSYPTYRNFRAHTRGMLNLTLSGFSNVGQDIGGWDDKGPDVLYARWFAAGTFYPFMWSHGQDDHEPYSHGPAVENAAREFLNLRYRLVPYFYSLHELAHRTGLPVLRAFPLQEPEDAAASRIDDQFFIGDNLLVAPIFNDRGDRHVYLPKGLWYDFFAEQAPVAGGRAIERTSVPLDRLPIYVRAGAVIPTGPIMQYTAEKPVDPLSVHVYSFDPQDLREARSSEFELYEDDGTSTNYQQNQFQRTQFRLLQTQEHVQFEVKEVSSDRKYRAVPHRHYQLYFHGFQGNAGSVLLDGKEIARAAEQASCDRVASWTIDKSSGNLILCVPQLPKHDFEVEFAIKNRRNAVEHASAGLDAR